MIPLHFDILDGDYTLHRFPPDSPIPPELLQRRFFSVTRTDEELSILCEADLPLPSPKKEMGWAGLKIRGPLDFSLIGILADVSDVLARAEIPLFAVSTYDTDYLFVPAGALHSARRALEEAGAIFSEN